VVDTTEAASAVEAGRMKTGDVAFVNGNKVTGTGTKTLSSANDTVNEGYYGATTLSAVDTDLVAANIKCGKTIFGVTGTLPPGCVAKTGQTDCYDVSGFEIDCAGTGQDGEYQMGCVPVVSPSGSGDFGNYKRTSLPCSSAGFTDNGDGTVTDNLTGLVWLKNADCFGWIWWDAALTACNNLATGTCGLTDFSSAGVWRLPNINELRSLLDPSLPSPYLPAGHPFTNVRTGDIFEDSYWSSTVVTGSLPIAYGWLVSIKEACIWEVLLDKNDPENSSFIGFHVWPVRSGN